MQIVNECGIQWGFDWFGPQVGDIGQPDAERREHACVRVDQHRGDAEPIGDPAGVLAAGTAETDERVRADIVAPLGADLADRVGHVLGCNLAVAEGHLGRGAAHAAGVANLVGQLGDAACGSIGVERLIAVGAEDGREVLGPYDTEHRVGIGERERAVVAVADRPGVSAGRLGAHTQAAAVEREQRSAPCSDRVHVDDRRTDADARHLGLVRPFELAGKMGDVGRRAAHVKADEPFEAGCLSRAGHADNAAGGTRQQCIAAGEAPGIGQTAVGLHELQLRPLCTVAERGIGRAVALRSVAAADSRRDSVDCADSRCHGIDVAAQDRGQVGVGHGGVAAGDDLDQRVHLVADRDLFEADLAGRSG